MRRVRRRDKRGWFLLLGVFVMVFLFTFLSQNHKRLDDEVKAASLANFDPGYIISDYQMSNYNSMTEEEIQTFLINKGNCRDTRVYLATTYSNYSYHIRDGHFVCMAEETFGDGVAYGEDAPDGETAAHVIWQAAQDYQINPQVLIVLLQKEQGLITDSWPNSRQYRSATGYGCPDTAPCNAEYYGFKNQVRKAAAMFRTVLDGGWTNYPLGNNYIQYNPNAACGGSIVNVRSLATSALYRYTPYQPNEGALAAGYGTAYCGAYGNRNFYLYFMDWFDDPSIDINVGSEIQKYYEFLNGKEGYLGEKVSDEICGLIKNGCYQVFEGGYLYWTKETGVYGIRKGKIFDYWFEQGTEWGTLGYPTSEETTIDNRVIQKFEKGWVYYNKLDEEVLYISGDILDYWQKLGAEKSVLGYPTSSEQKNADGIIYQTFEHGTIYWDVKTGAWVLRDFAAKKWEDLGGFGSKLKSIMNNGVCGLVKNGCYQAFKTGNIYWTEATGAYDVSGGIYQTYLKYGTEWGVLGYPTSSEQKNADGIIYQTFEHGTIYWNYHARVELN